MQMCSPSPLKFLEIMITESPFYILCFSHDFSKQNAQTTSVCMCDF